MSGFRAIFMKELRLEFRTRDSLTTMIVFSLSVILLFAFAFDAAPSRFRNLTPGLMWVTYFFTAVLGLLRSFGREKEMEAYNLLLSSPVSRGEIYLGKLGAFTLLLLIAQLLSLPVFAVLLELPVFVAPFRLLVIIIVADLAIGAVGTLIAAMSHRSPAGESLLPILAFPLLTPILIAASKATTAVVTEQPFAVWDSWLMLLITFFTFFILAGTFLYDYISEQ